MRALVIGGTRNLGPSIVQALLDGGDSVSVFNRGMTPDDLPAEVERLRGDRRDRQQLKATLGSRDFDVVVDTTLYTGAEAQGVVEVLSGRIGRYIFLSTGQVYLVRVGVKRPFKEEDYSGPVMAAPSRENESDFENWLYGHDKRDAEDIFAQAWSKTGFPYTSLRLPMVNSERDHYNRIYGYFRRIEDGGALVLPEGPDLPVRHVYGEDVIQAVMRAIKTDTSKGRAYNIGQDEFFSLEEFLRLLAEIMEKPLQIVRVPRDVLEKAGLLPNCSPFSGQWMSALDNSLSKAELGVQYTPLREYLRKLVKFFSQAPRRQIEGYERRPEELALADRLKTKVPTQL
jgi:nucleoside-diphosphate-sugar epimerase